MCHLLLVCIPLTCMHHFAFNISFVFFSFWEIIASLPDSGIGVPHLWNYFTHHCVRRHVILPDQKKPVWTLFYEQAFNNASWDNSHTFPSYNFLPLTLFPKKTLSTFFFHLNVWRRDAYYLPWRTFQLEFVTMVPLKSILLKISSFSEWESQAEGAHPMCIWFLFEPGHLGHLFFPMSRASFPDCLIITVFIFPAVHAAAFFPLKFQDLEQRLMY